MKLKRSLWEKLLSLAAAAAVERRDGIRPKTEIDRGKERTITTATTTVTTKGVHGR